MRPLVPVLEVLEHGTVRRAPVIDTKLVQCQLQQEVDLCRVACRGRRRDIPQRRLDRLGEQVGQLLVQEVRVQLAHALHTQHR